MTSDPVLWIPPSLSPTLRVSPEEPGALPSLHMPTRAWILYYRRSSGFVVERPDLPFRTPTLPRDKPSAGVTRKRGMSGLTGASTSGEVSLRTGSDVLCSSSPVASPLPSARARASSRPPVPAPELSRPGTPLRSRFRSRRRDPRPRLPPPRFGSAHPPRSSIDRE